MLILLPIILCYAAVLKFLTYYAQYLGLRLLCFKFYIFIFPEFLLKFTYYSKIILYKNRPFALDLCKFNNILLKYTYK